MERHKCKLCSRTFANGRALGGHMKAHLATLPLPPKPQPFPGRTDSPSLSYSSYFSSSSSSSSSSSEDDEETLARGESEEKGLSYGLRENPKKSFRLADPEFSFAADTGSVVQDRESETESKNPTRRRSKRNRKPSVVGIQGQNQNLEPKKPKLSFMESPTEPEPVSSVSDTSPDEDVAMCLMMLSRDRWKRNVVEQDQEEEEEEEVQRSIEKLKGFKEIKFKRVRGKHRCQNCGKLFRSSRALGSHKSICCRDAAEARIGGNEKIFECPFCFKIFGSGQALGGHKRSHLIPSSASTANNHSARLKEAFIDLNLPAQPEEDDLSVVSDA